MYTKLVLRVVHESGIREVPSSRLRSERAVDLRPISMSIDNSSIMDKGATYALGIWVRWDVFYPGQLGARVDRDGEADGRVDRFSIVCRDQVI